VAWPRNGPEEPDSDPEPPGQQEAPRLVQEVWGVVRTALQLYRLLVAGKHEGLHLSVQALVVVGDLVVERYLQGPHR
jgi:hypothetical protein